MKELFILLRSGAGRGHAWELSRAPRFIPWELHSPKGARPRASASSSARGPPAAEARKINSNRGGGFWSGSADSIRN